MKQAKNHLIGGITGGIGSKLAVKLSAGATGLLDMREKLLRVTRSIRIADSC
jgi:NH3-dependent NAD+ synthetase